MQIYPQRQPTFENWNIPYFYILETKNRNVPDVQNIAEAKLAGHLIKRFLKHSPKLKMPLRKSKFGEHLLNSSHKVDSFHGSSEILHTHKKRFMLDPIEEFSIGYKKQLIDTLNTFIDEKLNNGSQFNHSIQR